MVMPRTHALLAPLLGVALICACPEASKTPDATAQSDAAAPDIGASDIGASDFSSSDFGSSDFGSSDFGSSDFGSSDIGASDIGASADAGAPSCPASELGAALGRSHLLIGGSMDDTSFAAAPFDLGYRYVADRIPSDGPCASCASNCIVDGASCSNAEGCNWWGCWQWDQVPPGRYVADYLANTAAAGAVPMITYYIWHYVADYVEGAPEIAALQDGGRLAAFLADFRFLCQVMGEDPSITALLHLEPDLWGYGHQVNADPTQIPVALDAAGENACAGLGNHLAGLAQCMLAISRAAAPNVLVGFHASAWGAGHDALINSDPGFDLEDHANRTAAYMNALGADQADFVVVEMSDRDAAFSDRWWDASDASLPNFVQAIAWVEALGNGMGLAPLWWQLPYGHMGLENICDRYQDNRVDYIFDHPERFAQGGALGLAFGAGAGCQTRPATDDGNFIGRAQAYYAGARPLLCQ